MLRACVEAHAISAALGALEVGVGIMIATSILGEAVQPVREAPGAAEIPI